MTYNVAYFGHNPGDAAVRRRVSAFKRAGVRVTGFMPHREPFSPPPWEHVDLGETRDNDYRGRIRNIFAGSHKALQHADILRNADLYLARNLDMLALASRVRRAMHSKTPLVYECLDIHHRLTGPSPAPRMLRLLEKRLLRSTALVIVSSPRFVTEHFERYYPGLCKSLLMENRLISGDAFGPRPTLRTKPPEGPLRIGWFGNLRCRRSLDLLKMLAQRFPGRLQVTLRGYPAPGVFSDLEAEIDMYPNFSMLGRYRAPDDLERIYEDVDLVWAADWYEAGANSEWLLPNRIYEGGYFATPALAPAGTETGRWIAKREAGFLFNGTSPDDLFELVESLIDHRDSVEHRRNTLLALPLNSFVEGPNTVLSLIVAAGSRRS